MLEQPFNVFISWSGERSRQAAEQLRQWLPTVIQAAKPWMSGIDIDKGSTTLAEITKALGTCSVAIICLTPENLHSNWIHFEAGAISNHIGERTRICPLLLGELQHKDVRAPLSTFQGTLPSETEVKALVETINNAMGKAAIEPSILGTVFKRAWPELDAALTSISSQPGNLPAKPRSTDDILSEILDLVRALANDRTVWLNTLVQPYSVPLSSMLNVDPSSLYLSATRPMFKSGGGMTDDSPPAAAALQEGPFGRGARRSSKRTEPKDDGMPQKPPPGYINEDL